jgi:hypothetical protein
MKELKIRRQPLTIIKRSDILQFEKEIGIVLPEYFRDFLLKYAGALTEESIFARRYEIVQFLHLHPIGISPSIKRLWEGYLFYNTLGYFPFALDSPGWSINLSLREETYGQIWVNRDDDNYETAEECFQFVANNLEEFVNGLERREDVPGW